MSSPQNREEEIVDAALALRVEERAAYLDQVCGDDAELRGLVEGLLRAYHHASFPAEAHTRPPQTIRIVPAPLSEKPGDTIGRYKLLQQVGEGGCGVVYMAEQEEPVRRRVALKVIKLGMDTRQVIARFEAERQALALMDHPNIAKVLDGGATETGRPYFVMELVRGVKITEYCDQNNLPTEKRLELFIQVCKAIQHAHQKGIIHRDIKPSNILVTLHDGVPVPKVIDFGIAKAIEQKLTDKTLFTALEQFIGTPAYMSPEQAEMSGLDIDTRSDIYSLGVLLYELLTSKLPFEQKNLIRAGLDEMRRIIRETDPVRPSTRLSSLEAGEQTTVARRRQVEAVKLIHIVRGDLDWIVMKCLEKDRTRRYETANGLASDLQRHMEDEPVVARPPNAAYRFQKLVRRNQLAFTAAGAVILALVAGLGLATISFFRERAQRVRAVRAESTQNQLRLKAEAETKKAAAEAARSDQVARLLKKMLKGVSPAVARGRDTVMLREILGQTADQLSSELKDQPEVEADMRGTLASTYFALGDYEKAADMLRSELDLVVRIHGEQHPAALDALNNLGVALCDLGKFAEAEKIDRQLLAANTKAFGPQSEQVARSLANLGTVLWSEGHLPEAETAMREALATNRKILGNENADVAMALHNLAVLLDSEGKVADAETAQREALDIQRKVLGEIHPHLAASLNTLGAIQFNAGKMADAEATQRAAVTMMEKLFGGEHPNLAIALDNLATFQRELNRLPEAEASNRRALAMTRKLLGEKHPNVATSLDNLGLVLCMETNLVAAEQAQREALGLRRKVLGENHPAVANSLEHLARTLRKLKRFDEAESLANQSLALRRKLAGKDDMNVPMSLGALAEILRDQHKYADAEPVLREALQLLEQAHPEHPRTLITQANLGAVLVDLRRYADAEPVLLSVIEALQKQADKRDLRADLTSAVENLTRLYDENKQPEKAANWRRHLEETARSATVAPRAEK